MFDTGGDAVFLNAANDFVYFPFDVSNVTFYLYIISILIWIRQVERRVLQRTIRKYLCNVGYLMLLLIALRTMKYAYFTDDTFGRYLWYLYYFPFLFSAQFLFFAVLYIGKREEEGIHEGWKVLYLFTSFLFVLILTNDSHQLAFRFVSGYENYTHRIVYFLALFYISALLMGTVGITFMRCNSWKKRRYIWAPFLPLFLAGIYSLGYFGNLSFRIFIMFFQVPELGCVVLISFLECLLLTHLLPTNDSYTDFWKMSSLRAGIMDHNGDVRYLSSQGILVDGKLLDQGKVSYLDEDTMLESCPIHGGRAYWLKDIRNLKRLNEELQEIGDVLAEENEIIKAENTMREDRLRIHQQSQLYRRISRELSAPLTQLDDILSALPSEEEAFRETMKKAALLHVYVKHSSNLLLLAELRNGIPCAELELAFRESCEYLKLASKEVCIIWEATGEVATADALLLYKRFELILESLFSDFRQLYLRVGCEEERLCFHLELHSMKAYGGVKECQRRFAQHKGFFTGEYDREEKTQYLFFWLPLKEDVYAG